VLAVTTEVSPFQIMGYLCSVMYFYFERKPKKKKGGKGEKPVSVEADAVSSIIILSHDILWFLFSSITWLLKHTLTFGGFVGLNNGPSKMS
jgi:hypothetical protein